MAGDSVAAAPRPVSEPTRQLETYKYDPSLLTSIKYNDDGVPVPSSELVTSHDTVLTALAQLGACRLKTARSLISLFDKDYQYVVAEATPTLSLLPSLKHEDREEDLWLCGTAIPRCHGVCEYTLSLDDPTQFECGDGPKDLPLALVSDLTTDPRFSDKPYCRPGAPARFYASVPIQTRRGINIGVYCAIDTEPRDISEWDPASTGVMRNISRAIMSHLEARRSNLIHERSSRMNRGLGSFVEGKEALSGWSRQLKDPVVDGDAPQMPRRDSTRQEAAAEANGHNRAGAEAENDPPAVHAIPSSHASTPDQGHGLAKTLSGRRSTGKGQEPSHQIFARAANMIRQSIEVDGFIFLSASTASDAGVLESHGRDTDSTGSQSASAASSDDARARHSADYSTLQCRVLGESASDPPDSGRSAQYGSVPRRFLSKLLRRYPRGTIFSFDESREVQSSDSSGAERVSARGSSEDEEAPQRRQRSPPWSRANEGSTILEVFPGARSVAFVPVWDAKREVWFAGGFAYTYAATRIFTIRRELSYLRAFGMLAMEEYLRLEMQAADKAKSDLLNSLSHELRSPLHGILLGVELLSDTKLDVFQGNVLHTLETCGRTLLDTVDHLLDFSKINNYLANMKIQGRAVGARGMREGRSRTIEAGMKSLYSDVRLDLLVEEVMESVFAGFHFQRISVSQLAQHGPARHADVHANRWLDSARAMEDLGPGQMENGQLLLDFGRVAVFLDVDPTCSWTFHTQPGAIRRMVMNLFGNSLKYTRQGSIIVSLKQDDSRRHRGKVRSVILGVTDTGKGISEDFLQHKLFRPFSQEDNLAPGAGLGLSLVKQITSQFKGNIAVESRVGCGTAVSVTLPLLPVAASAGSAAAAPPEEHVKIVEELSALKGLSVRLLGFGGSQASKGPDATTELVSDDLYTPIERICRGWFQMEVLPESRAQTTAPDLVLCMADASGALPPECKGLATAPTVVVCPNALLAYQLATSPVFTENLGVFEFISQPTGPRKLAKALSLALERSRRVPMLAPSEEKAAPEEEVMEVMSSPVLELAPALDVSIHSSQALETVAVDVNLAMVQPTTTAPQDLTPATQAAPQFLLVDDNDINLKILSSYMKKIDRRYATATNGLEAVKAFCQTPGRYRCVFMDISMPVMDGFEATRRIRAHEREKGLKPAAIFALSGLASAAAQQEAFDSGIDLFLTKPVKLRELGSILGDSGLL